jgi:thiosulfate dehydrogenase [quinone] large subunit
MALLPLRLFLGITFAYAGIQKLSDPGFLHPGAPTYIGTQLQGFANGTPGGFILHTFALPHPELAGIGVAIIEIAIGLLTIAGLMTRIAAAAGLALSLLLFLTASWHTAPYFLGPDIVFVFAWLPFVLAGAAGQPALDNMAERPLPDSPQRESLLTRRALVAQVGAMALAVAGIASLVKGTYRAPAAVAGTRTDGAAGSGSVSGGGGGSGGGAGGGSGGGAGGSAPIPPNAVALASSSRLPSGQGATYTDPGDGGTDLIIRQSDGSLTAFSAVCTHAGCTVGYQGGQIVCPCHGATYDPTTGTVTGGPAPQGLSPKKVFEQQGKIYAIPS